MKYLVFGASWCQHCANATALLEHYGIWYDYLSVDDAIEEEAETNQQFLRERGLRSLPQIFEIQLNKEPRLVGGYTELRKELLRKGDGETET